MTLVPCTHWSLLNPPERGGGRCAIGRFGGRPAVGACIVRCRDYEGPPRGIGDRLHGWALALLGKRVKGCRGCRRRAVGANRVLPAGWTKRVRRPEGAGHG